MIIAEKKDKILGIFDIETCKELFDIGIYNPDSDEWEEYEISSFKNDLFKIINVYNSTKYDYWVSFNGIGFDHQVLEFMNINYQKWYDFSGLEICKIIYNFVQELIDNQNYKISLPFKEEKFVVKPIDLFRIHHFNNSARRTS